MTSEQPPCTECYAEAKADEENPATAWRLLVGLCISPKRKARRLEVIEEAHWSGELYLGWMLWPREVFLFSISQNVRKVNDRWHFFWRIWGEYWEIHWATQWLPSTDCPTRLYKRVYPFEMSVWACAVFSHALHDVSWAVDIIYIPKWAKGKW